MEKSKVLCLPLKKEWYNMIESGIKKEEYREIKPHWTSRIVGSGIDVVRFSYGYTKRVMEYEVVDITTGVGNRDWGAPDCDVYIIKLGRRLK